LRERERARARHRHRHRHTHTHTHAHAHTHSPNTYSGGGQEYCSACDPNAQALAGSTNAWACRCNAGFRSLLLLSRSICRALLPLAGCTNALACCCNAGFRSPLSIYIYICLFCSSVGLFVGLFCRWTPLRMFEVWQVIFLR
jgi:hypothetical protein